MVGEVPGGGHRGKPATSGGAVCISSCQHTSIYNNLAHPWTPIRQLHCREKKKTLWPIFMDGAQLSQGYSHYKETVYFLPLSRRKSSYSFDWPWKDERLSWPCSNSVVLNQGPLDWESSTLTTRSLLHKGDTPRYTQTQTSIKQHSSLAVPWQFFSEYNLTNRCISLSNSFGNLQQLLQQCSFIYCLRDIKILFCLAGPMQKSLI